MRAGRFAKASGSEEVDLADACDFALDEDESMKDDVDYEPEDQYRPLSSPSNLKPSRNSANTSTTNASISSTTVNRSSSRSQPNSLSDITAISSRTNVPSNHWIVHISLE